jgi:hypothetical protein
VSLSKRLKTFKPFQLASIAFYAVTGLILFAFLPLTGYPPHLGFLGIFSLITAYRLFFKRGWAPWLVAVGFSNIIVALSMLTYAVLTWVFTANLLLKRKD